MGGIVGAVVGGVGMMFGGGSLLYQRKQNSLKRREIEMRESGSSFAQKQSDMKQSLQTLEQKKALLESANTTLRQGRLELETKTLMLSREREALERQRSDLQTRMSKSEEAWVTKERDQLIANERAKALKEATEAKQYHTEVLQAKEGELGELKATRERLKTSNMCAYDQIKQLERKLEALRNEKKEFEQSLSSVLADPQGIGQQSRGDFSSEPKTASELILTIQRQVQFLCSAKAAEQRDHQHDATQLGQARVSLSKLEVERQVLEKKYQEELKTLRQEYKHLQSQSRIQMLPDSDTGGQLTDALGRCDSHNSTMDVEYNQEVQDALEQVSRLKMRLEALRYRKKDRTMKSEKAPDRLCLHPGVSATMSMDPTVPQSLSDAVEAVSPLSTASSDFQRSEEVIDQHDSLTSGSIHESSGSECQHSLHKGNLISTNASSSSHGPVEAQDKNEDQPETDQHQIGDHSRTHEQEAADEHQSGEDQQEDEGQQADEDQPPDERRDEDESKSEDRPHGVPAGSETSGAVLASACDADDGPGKVTTPVSSESRYNSSAAVIDDGTEVMPTT